MRPFASLSPLANWMLRGGLLLLVSAHLWPILKDFQFSSITSITAAAFALFTVLLFMGGFSKKHTLTMLSGLAMMLLAGWHAYSSGIFSLLNTTFAAYMLTGVIGFHFFINGNK
jgi:hypothetical protein